MELIQKPVPFYVPQILQGNTGTMYYFCFVVM